MKIRILRWIAVAALGFGAMIGALHAENFESVFGSEDPALRPLPPEALAAVRAHARTTDYSDCATGGFVGTAVDLTGQGQARDWIAKTENGCAWGASSVVIWVLKREPDGYHVVLYSGGQVVSLQKAGAGKVADLQIISRTAGHYAETNYRFDGKTYTESGSRLVDLSDPADCKRNRDICE